MKSQLLKERLQNPGQQFKYANELKQRVLTLIEMDASNMIEQQIPDIKYAMKVIMETDGWHSCNGVSARAVDILRDAILLAKDAK